MTTFRPDLRSQLALLEGNERSPIPEPRPGRSYSTIFDLLGTAHFTRRSIVEAMTAASSPLHASVAIELDRVRFEELAGIGYSVRKPWRETAEGEFVAGTDAFGNRNGDVWLIDWGVDEIIARIGMAVTWPEVRDWKHASTQMFPNEEAGTRLWEIGTKQEALRYHDPPAKAMRDNFPSLHRVLIEERNLVMASRLLEIANGNVELVGKTLVLVGMAHVDGIRELLEEPGRILQGFETRGLNYSPPTRVRRVKVN